MAEPLFSPLRRIPQLFAEWQRYFRDVNDKFEPGSFTGTLTGVDSVVTGTVRYARSNHLVLVNFPDLLGTSDSTAATVTGMPALIHPQRQHRTVGRVRDNGTTAFGLISFDTDGTITLFPGAPGGTFTAANQKGLEDCTVGYFLT